MPRVGQKPKHIKKNIKKTKKAQGSSLGNGFPLFGVACGNYCGGFPCFVTEACSPFSTIMRLCEGRKEGRA